MWIDSQLALFWLESIFGPLTATVVGVTRLLIIDRPGSHITYAFVKFCAEYNILLLCLPSHSTHLLPPLDIGLFSPYQPFYGLAVDNHICSRRKTIDGIKKAMFLAFDTETREKAFTLQNICHGLEPGGIWPIFARRVLWKIVWEAVWRCDTMGLITTPRKRRDIKLRIMAAETRLDETLASWLLSDLALALPPTFISGASSERPTLGVKCILPELGHQLETEVAQRELYQEQSRRLQQVAPLNNQTDRRKLSEGHILSQAQLVELQDARLTKDTEKGQKLPKGVSKLSESLPGVKLQSLLYLLPFLEVLSLRLLVTARWQYSVIKRGIWALSDNLCPGDLLEQNIWFPPQHNRRPLYSLTICHFNYGSPDLHLFVEFFSEYSCTLFSCCWYFYFAPTDLQALSDYLSFSFPLCLWHVQHFHVFCYIF